MANLGKNILGTYSASCEELRNACPVGQVPQVGDIVFFASATQPVSNHAGLIYKVTGSTIYTIEGDTTGANGLVENGNCVATKSYSKIYNRILSYGRPRYTDANPAAKVIDVAVQEVGYLEKKTNKKLNSKTANAGSGNFTKYGKWSGVNGATWSGSFISWCFSAAFDSSFSGVIGNDPKDTAINDEESTVFINQSGSSSSLVSYVNRLSNAAINPRPGRIACITIHIAKKIGDIYDLAAMLNSSQKSYNYGIDNSGVIGLFTDETSWTDSSNNTENDMRAVNIICTNDLLEPQYRITSDCYKSLVNLCEDICRRNFIFALQYTNNPQVDSITLHQQFNKKSECPGPYVTNTVIPKLIEEVNAKIGAEINPITGAVTTKVRLATSQTEALKAQSTVSIKSIRPYVIQPNASMLNLDYEKLKTLGVVGTMLDAGERYNRKHELVTYRTDNIYKQTEEAIAANIPFSFIYTTHARTPAEVKEEAYWFYFIVSKYPPKLGVWLHCEFDVNQSVAETLVDAWYQYFIRWGLKSKCGIYATKNQALNLGWPKQCAYMPLWLENEFTDSVCPDEEILTPSFFKLNDLTNKSGELSTVMLEYESTNLGSAGNITASQIGKMLEDLKGKYLTDEDEKAEKTQTDSYTDIAVPIESKYTGRKNWEGYATIKKSNKWSYNITHNELTGSDSDGFLKTDNRYLVAVGTGVSNTVGTYLDITLQNGVVIPCIVGDIILDNVSDPINHIFSTIDESYSCSQFIVVNTEGVLNSEVRKTGDCSYKSDDWRSPVTSFKVYNKNWFIKEE